MNRIESQLLPGAPNAADGYLRRAVLGTICGYLLSGAPNPADGYLRLWAHEEIGVASGGPAFPTQFSGLRTYYGGSVRELCMVAEADAPAAMGGVIKIDKNGTVLAVYLVETSDPDASSVRVQTSAGTKSIRLKT